MNDFQSLKTQYGCTPKYPFPMPLHMAPCDHCDTETGTKVFFMKAGLGNACINCGRLRRGEPYLSADKFQSLKLNSAQGENDGTKAT